jgi:hypothetical protein
MLVLVLASKSPSKIGEYVWSEIPTVRSLVKMIVSNRYRFPTVDCDDSARERMKEGEQKSRDKVRFLPSLLPSV